VDYTFVDIWNQWSPSAPNSFISLPMFNNWISNNEFKQEIYEYTANVFCNNGALTKQASIDRMNEWINEASDAMYSEVYLAAQQGAIIVP